MQTWLISWLYLSTVVCFEVTASPLRLYFPKRPLIHGGCVSLKGPSYMGLTMYSLVTNRGYAGGKSTYRSLQTNSQEVGEWDTEAWLELRHHRDFLPFFICHI